MLAPAPTAPSMQRRLRRPTPAPGPVVPASVSATAGLGPVTTGLGPFTSRHRPGVATIEELVARDIEAFSARPRP